MLSSYACNLTIIFPLFNSKAMKKNFAYLPRTRLSRLMRASTTEEILALCDGFTTKEDGHSQPEYFFNRSWTSFNSILDFYRMGNLHCSVETCAMVFKEDLAFWAIDELFLDPCCALRFYPELEACHKEVKGQKEAKQRADDRKFYENFGETKFGKVRSKLWSMTEYPESSISAQVWIVDLG